MTKERNWKTIPQLADSYQPTSFLKYGWIRRLLARLFVWLAEPVLGPILETHHCRIGTLDGYTSKNMSEITAMKLTDGALEKAIEKNEFHHDQLAMNIKHVCALLQIEKLSEEPAGHPRHKKMTIPTYGSKWMTETRNWIARLEGTQKLHKAAFSKVPQMDQFLGVIMKKMDWKLVDEPGARPENLEAWTCGVLDIMNRSSMAMERLLGLELNDDPMKDKLTKLPDTEHLGPAVQELELMVGDINTALDMQVAQGEADAYSNRVEYIDHWCNLVATCLGLTIGKDDQQIEVITSLTIENIKVDMHKALMQRNHDVNEYLKWKRQVDNITQEHHGRLHDLDGMHNIT